MGVAEVFTPGASLPTIIERVTEALERREEAPTED
jgi:methylmalonyl-CoA mutase cobalamin-binding subunit